MFVNKKIFTIFIYQKSIDKYFPPAFGGREVFIALFGESGLIITNINMADNDEKIHIHNGSG